MEERAQEDADPINPQRVFWELSPRLPDDCIISCRLGLGRELVRPRPEAPPRDDGVALGNARDDGPGRSVRDRGEVRASRPACDRARRRRRDADERPQRADHDREVLAALERPAARRARAQQPRPEPGDVGAARDAGRPEVRGAAVDPRLPVREVRASSSASRACASTIPTRSATPGTRRSPPTARSCSRRSSTPRCRRCRRTSRSSRPSTSPRPCSRRPATRADDQRSRSGRCSTRCTPGDDMAAVAPQRVDAAVGDLRPRRTPSRQTHPSPTARSSGTRRRSCSSRSQAGDETGIGWTYGAAAAANVVDERARRRRSLGSSAFDVRGGAGSRCARKLRNAGYPGSARRPSPPSTSRSGT